MEQLQRIMLHGLGITELRRLITGGILVALTAIGSAQTTGQVVQAEINAAIAAGQMLYRLPAGQILLTDSLRIPPGTRNFTIQGQSGTRLVRNSTADFPLLAIGNPTWSAFLPGGLSALPRVAVAPANEGDHFLVRTGGITVTPGWYMIVGTDPINDVVKHAHSDLTYVFRSELIRITAVIGDQLQLAHPLGRQFLSPELRLVEVDGAGPLDRRMVENITVRDFSADGRSTINGSVANKVIVAGFGSDVTFDDLTILNFNNAGVSAMVTKGSLFNRLRISDGNLTQLGYGIEIAGSRFTTVRNSTFTRMRTGVIFQPSNMDALVEDCSGPTVNFDLGHGTGDLRIIYRRTVGEVFTIANPTWRRGVDRVMMDNCTALREINIYGNASNVIIRGMHPSHTQTSPLINLFTEGNGNAIPGGVTFPLSVTLENGRSNRNVLDGVNLRLLSLSNTPTALGSLTVRNWTFINPILWDAPNVNLAPGVSNSPVVLFENCNFTNSGMWNANITVGPVTGNNRWDVVVRNSRMTSPGTHAAWVLPGARGSVVFESTTMNNQSTSTANIRGIENLPGFALR